MENTSPPAPDPDVSAEFRKLGENLRDVVKQAWDSEERQRLQMELQKGLMLLTANVKDLTENFAASDTGQRVKSEVDGLRTRVAQSEVEKHVRTNIVSALRVLNTELEKAAHKSAAADAPPTEPPVAEPKPEADAEKTA
jgi:hypothetical protein